MFRTLTQQVLRTATLAVVVGMAGCASLPQPHDDGALQREAMAGTHNPVPAPLPLNNDAGSGSEAPAQAEVSRGSGQFIRPSALSTPRPAASAAPAPAAVGATAAASAATSANGVIVFRTKGASWVQVTDAKGATVLRRLMAAGESAGASGALPLAVTVGDAAQTDVTVRGQPFNLAPVSRDNVARFEVK